MSVRKIRDSWWVDFRVEDVRYRKRSPDNTRAGAAAYEALVRGRLARGEPIDGESARHRAEAPGFAEFSERWLESYSKPNHKPSNYAGNKRRVRVLIACFGTRRLDEIEAIDVERFKTNQLARGLAPASINALLVTLRKILQTAVDWTCLAAVPKVKKLREPPPPFAFLSSEECEGLLSDKSDRRCHEMVLLALRTGMRVGEILGLDWSDVDFDRRIVTVRRSAWCGQLVAPKSGTQRHIPMTSDLADAIAWRRQAQGLLFSGRRGHPLSDWPARHALRGLCRRTGVRYAGWHALRHTFSSMLVMKGVPRTVVQALLGHADLRMTLRYSHLAPSATRDAVELLVPQIARNGHPVGNADPEAVPDRPPVPLEIGATTLPASRHAVAVAT